MTKFRETVPDEMLIFPFSIDSALIKGMFYGVIVSEISDFGEKLTPKIRR